MSLENYTGYIPALVDTNPEADDPKSEGDDHLRGIKETLTKTFVGFTEANQGVEVTATEINEVCAGGANNRMPTGMIAMFGMNDAPTGWLPCDGRTVGRTVRPELFAAIGTTWGDGDGSTTFNVPDLEDYFTRGVSDTRPIATEETDAIKFHTHTIQPDSHTHTADNAGAHTHSTSDVLRRNGNDWRGSDSGNGSSIVHPNTSIAGDHTHTINADSHTHIADGFGDVETRPYNKAVRYCIKW